MLPENFIEFASFNGVALSSQQGVLNTDTFDIWRKKTNGIIDHMTDNEYVLKQDAVLLATNQTLTGLKYFQSGLSLGSSTNGSSTLEYNSSTLGANFSTPLKINGLCETSKIISTGTTAKFGTLDYTVPTINEDGFAKNDGNGGISWYPLNTLITAVSEGINSTTSITYLAELVPVGTVSAYASSSTLPAGWLICNGNTFDQAVYQDLYTALGSNTLPDLQSKVLVGDDAGAALSLRGTFGSTDLTTNNNAYYVVNYIIKALKDPTVNFSIIPGNGINTFKTGESTSSALDLNGGTVSIKANTTTFGFDGGGSLIIKAGGINKSQIGDAAIAATANTIPVRSSTGQLTVAETPIANTDAVSKIYVDSIGISKEHTFKAINSKSTCAYHASGYRSYSYIDGEDDVFVFGDNTFGQFGEGSAYARGWNLPTPTPSASPKQIYVDNYNTYILYDNNKVYSHGWNLIRKTGSISPNVDQTILSGPRIAFGGATIQKLILSFAQDSKVMYALGTDGALWAAGDNTHGQLGDGTTVSTSATKLPFKTIGPGASNNPLPTGQTVVDAWVIGSGGFETVYAKSSVSELWVCGYGGSGLNGNGNTNAVNSVWTRVKNYTSEDLSGITLSGTTYTKASHGLTTFDILQFTTPSTRYYVKVLNANTFTLHTTVESANNGTSLQTPAPTAAKVWKKLTGVADCYFGGSSSSTFGFIKTINKNLYALGDNTYGQLGLGTTSRWSLPKETVGSGNVENVYTDLGATAHYTNTSAKLYGTGHNHNGQVGNDSTTAVQSWTQIKFGITETVTGMFSTGGNASLGGSRYAVWTGGKLTGWGHNASRSLGVQGTDAYIKEPTEIFFKANTTAISTISSHDLGNNNFSTTLLLGTANPNYNAAYTCGFQAWNHNAYAIELLVPYFTRIKNI